MSEERLIAFAYMGGKNNAVGWLLPLLPKHARIYVEPFGGSAAVLLNREPAILEVYNDIDGNLVNFFRTLRERGEELIDKLTFTLSAHEEFETACQFIDLPETKKRKNPVEWARCFFVLVQQSMGGLVTIEQGRRWAPRRRRQSPRDWSHYVQRLWPLIDRLANVQIEHIDALDCIRKFDMPDGLIYEDPPYVPAGRSHGGSAYYHNELPVWQHKELAAVNNAAKSKIALSGYDGDLYRMLYDEKGWHRFEHKSVVSATFGHRPERTEILWTNYDPDDCEETESSATTLEEWME